MEKTKPIFIDPELHTEIVKFCKAKMSMKEYIEKLVKADTEFNKWCEEELIKNKLFKEYSEK